MLDIMTIPFIILTVYVLAEFGKVFIFTTDNRRKLLPATAAVIGGVLAVLLFFFIPGAMTNFDNVVEACTSGMASGLAATGCNQVYKQFKAYLSKEE